MLLIQANRRLTDHLAAVDGDRLAGHERSLVAGQIRGRPPDLLGPAPAARWDCGRMGIFVGLRVALAPLRRNSSGCDHVERDPSLQAGLEIVRSQPQGVVIGCEGRRRVVRRGQDVAQVEVRNLG